ncbi:hypothetical protein AB4156_42115, partial [Cupriavidus sp. 2MCAB6]
MAGRVHPSVKDRAPRHSARARNGDIAQGDRFHSYGQLFHCFDVRPHPTAAGFEIDFRWLETKCEDCRRPFSFRATLAEISRDQLRRRCNGCKKPGRVTKAVSPHAVAKRRRTAAEKRKLMLDATHLAKMEKAASAATEKPSPRELSDIFRADQR